MPEDRPGPHVAVIGAGVAGLTAAFHLVRDAETEGWPLRVTVFEGSPRLGGKLRVSEVAGVPVDEGAESMLARRPEGVELARAAGLGDALAHPARVSAALLSYGALRPFPARQVQGVPGDLDALAASGVVSQAGLDRAHRDLDAPATPLDGDVSVGAYVGERLGREVVDRLVEPLLGGVYAGRADHLSLAATLPAVYEAAQERPSLVAAARSLLPPAPQAGTPAGPPAPVFATVDGGMGRVPHALAGAVAASGRGGVRTSAMVRELRRTPDGWRLTVGPTRAPEYAHADAVIVAVPARPASRLLAGVAPAAAARLARVEYASMAIVTLAYPASAFAAPPSGSGYLVPAVETDPVTGERRAVKAVTFVTTKWPHLARRADDLVLVRCSLGRYGDEHVLQRDDADLAALAAGELAGVCGIAGPPVASRVTRWGGGLPQYGVGHLDLVAGVRADVARVPGLAVCGAAYDGVGVPACAATARGAAGLVRAHLTTARQWISEDDGVRGSAGQ